MKKGIFTITIAMIIATTVLISCKQSTREEVVLEDKLQDAKENVDIVKDSLVAARKAATAEEWQSFKNEADSIINVNDARIAELKLKMKKTGKSIDAQYEKNIEAMEQKNKNLKVKIKTYKNEVDADWQSFKSEFNHDMTEIGQALKNTRVDNKK